MYYDGGDTVDGTTWVREQLDRLDAEHGPPPPWTSYKTSTEEEEMSTNYYVRTEPSCGGKCEQHCHGEDIHLGKSSAGWAFTFRAYPHPDYSNGVVTWNVTDYETWLELLSLGTVFDEYGREVSPADLLAEIKSKRDGHHHVPQPVNGVFRDADGNDFIDREFS